VAALARALPLGAPLEVIAADSVELGDALRVADALLLGRGDAVAALTLGAALIDALADSPLALGAAVSERLCRVDALVLAEPETAALRVSIADAEYGRVCGADALRGALARGVVEADAVADCAPLPDGDAREEAVARELRERAALRVAALALAQPLGEPLGGGEHDTDADAVGESLGRALFDWRRERDDDAVVHALCDEAAD
jgi:hypothetical protein